MTPYLLLMRLCHLVIIKLNLRRNCSHKLFISFRNINKIKCLKYLEYCTKYLCINQESTFWAYSPALDKIHVWNGKKKKIPPPNFFPFIHTTATDLSLKLNHLPLALLKFFLLLKLIYEDVFSASEHDSPTYTFYDTSVAWEISCSI